MTSSNLIQMIMLLKSMAKYIYTVNLKNKKKGYELKSFGASGYSPKTIRFAI